MKPNGKTRNAAEGAGQAKEAGRGRGRVKHAPIYSSDGKVELMAKYSI